MRPVPRRHLRGVPVRRRHRAADPADRGRPRPQQPGEGARPDHAPTLLVQGTQDSLFGLGQADANARGIAAAGTPVKVRLVRGRARRATVRPRRPGPPRPGRRLVRLLPAQAAARPGHRLRVPGADRARRWQERDRAGRHPDRRRGHATPGSPAAPPRGHRCRLERAAPSPIVTPAGRHPGRAQHPAGSGVARRRARGHHGRDPRAVRRLRQRAAGRPPSTSSALRPSTLDVSRPGQRHAVRQALRRRARWRHDPALGSGRAALAGRVSRPTPPRRRGCA